MPAVSSSDAESPPRRAAVIAPAGPTLADAERRLLATWNPLGFILFARNCTTPGQVRGLIADLRAAVGREDAPVFIDQEGGRVMRLRPPHWPERVPVRAVGELAEREPEAGREAAWLHGRLIADDLAALGIVVDCAPVLDLCLEGRTPAIGDRAFGADPDLVGGLGEAMIAGLEAGGVLPVIKHLPGHGRAEVDSHVALPVVRESPEVLAASDWRPFVRCANAAFAMTAHVLYPALDPDHPATLSSRIIGDVIRARIAFGSALLSDDLSMGALGGGLGERAARARAAGCDLALHCNGDLVEMIEVLDAAGPLEGESAVRVDGALARRRPPQALDRIAGEARLQALLDRRVATLGPSA